MATFNYSDIAIVAFEDLVGSGNGSDLSMTTSAPGCLYKQTLSGTSVFDQIIFIMFVPILGLIALFGIVGNCLSYAVLAREMRRDGSSFCLKALAIVDNTVLVSYVWYFIPPTVFKYSGLLEGYYEIHMLLKPYLWTLVWITKAVSIYIVVFVTCERYIAVSRPLKAHVYCTEKAAKIGLFIIVVCAILYNLPKIWTFETKYKYDICSGRDRPWTSLTHPLYNNTYFRIIYVKAMYIIIMFTFPLVILSILNFQLVRHVRRANRIRMQMSTQQRNKGTDSTTQRIIGVVFAFIVLETPAISLNILYIFKDYWQGEPLAVDWVLVKFIMRSTYILSIVNSTINFYIYVLIGKRFRRILKKMCTCSPKPPTCPESTYMSVHRNSESYMTVYRLSNNNRRSPSLTEVV